uniref:Uncharacterized protein n=1 Tax=Salix viminalis TaxID=40686 RepID=A0A6N2K796_SALVM
MEKIKMTASKTITTTAFFTLSLDNLQELILSTTLIASPIIFCKRRENEGSVSLGYLPLLYSDDVLALDGTSGNKPLCLEEKLVSIKVAEDVGIPCLWVENSFTLLWFGYLQEEDDYKVIRCFRMYDKPFVDIDSYELEDFGGIPSELQAAIFLGNIFSYPENAHIPTPSITNKPETRTTEQRLYISHSKDQNFVSDFGGR